jgi:hypothetical protein
VKRGELYLSGARLTDANLENARLTNAQLSGAYLAGAYFRGATLRGANLSLTDMRGAMEVTTDTAASLRNTIFPDGTIQGLNLAADETLVIRDGELPITINLGMSLADSSILTIIVVDADWGSTISLAPGVTADLGGTLELRFGAEANVAGLVGVPLKLFN